MSKFTLSQITKEFVESNPSLNKYSVATVREAYKEIKSLVGTKIYTFTKKQFVTYFNSIKILYDTKKDAQIINQLKKKQAELKEPIIAEYDPKAPRVLEAPIVADPNTIYVPELDNGDYVYTTLDELCNEMKEQYGDHTNQYTIVIFNSLSNDLSKAQGKIGMKLATIDSLGYEHLEYIVDNILSGIGAEGDTNSAGEVKKVRDIKEEKTYFRAEMRPLAGGCSKQHMVMKVPKKVGIYSCTLYSPKSHGNNCAFSCINHILSGVITRLQYKEERINLGVSEEALISPEQVISIYARLKKEYKIEKDLVIVTENYCGEIILEDNHYLFLDSEHYRVIQSYEIVEKKQATKCGYLFWDCEARENEEHQYRVTVEGQSKMVNRLDDTITHIYFKSYKKESWQALSFTTDDNKTSVRKFADFLINENREGRSYNCFAHNGSRFDMYLFMACLTKDELTQSRMTLRGMGVIKFELFNSTFKDTCCFLTNSLDNLCENFRIQQRKLTKIEYNGNIYSNTELCFYKPELTFKQFMQLEQTEPKYWELYNNYCMFDCISLSEIWTKFTLTINTLVKSLSEELMLKCDVNKALTIGSFAKSLLLEYNKLKNKDLFAEVQEFCNTQEKYDFLNRSFISEDGEVVRTFFKRGGISHCNQAGKHNESIVGYDIKSQYPASMIHMNIAAGKSHFTTEYDSNDFGFYHIKDIKFKSDYKLKPVSTIKDSGVLEWNTERKIAEGSFDSDMIETLVNDYGMKFTVVKGLVTKKSTRGDAFFGDFINKFYAEKARQDSEKKKEEKDLPNEYNPALREAIKLVINSLSGKLVEDIDYRSVTWSNNAGLKQIGGVSFTLDKNESKKKDAITFNWLLPLGIMVYSFSKRLLFNYINCLPNKSDDIVHIETDGIYFAKRHEEEFLYNMQNLDSDLVVMGEELGNIEKDCETVGASYWLGKKFYQYDKEKKGCVKTIMRIKGVPLQSIDDHGSKTNVVTKQTYLDVYSGKIFKAGFKTIKKDLYGGEVKMLSFNMSREIKPNMEYKEYF